MGHAAQKKQTSIFIIYFLYLTKMLHDSEEDERGGGERGEDEA